MDNCTIDCIQKMGQFNYDQTCKIVQDLCIQDTIQFIQAYYCIGNGSFFLLMGIGFILLLFLYRAMDKLAGDYLTPCVDQFIDKFKISPSLAGVTFLAFANGAPDVLTAVVAGSSDSSSTVLIPFGSIFGACLFSTTIILSTVIYTLPSGQIKVDKIQILKPVIFYVIGILYLFLISIFYQKMNIYISISLLFLYIIFICFVIRTQQKFRKARKFNKQQKFVKTHSQISNDSQQLKNPAINNQIIESETTQPIQKQQEQQKSKYKIINLIDGFQEIVFTYALPPISPRSWTPLKAIISLSISPFVLALTQGLSSITENNILNLPLVIYLSIPSILFLIHTVYLIIRQQKPTNMILYVLYTFIVAIGWLTLVCSVLINIIQLFQLLTDINSVFLGLTILAWANCIGDYLSITAFASKGNASTAVSGIFSGQLFNFLVGFSASLVIQSLNGQFDFDIFNLNGSAYNILSDSIVIIVMIAGFVYLILIIFLVILKSGVFQKRQGFISRAYYATFLIIAIGIATISDFFRQFNCDL